MKAFKYHVPTPIYFGENSLKNNAKLIAGLGKRAFIITSRFKDGVKSLALEDTKALLEELGIAYEVNEEVEENPSTESCFAIGKAAAAFKPDFLFGIGGGSSLDTCKVVNLYLEHPEVQTFEEVNALFFGKGTDIYSVVGAEGKLPMVAIPTTAGTGSEVTSSAVITRNELHTKSVPPHNVYYTYAFLDYRYIKDSPLFLLDTGAMDALAHGMETYVNVNSSFYSRAIAEIGFKLFSKFKDHLLEGKLEREDFESMLLASTIASSAMMHGGTTLPHGMGYALSHFKHVNHGLSCSIFLGEYLKSIRDQSIVQSVVEMCGFKDSAEMAAYCARLIQRDVHITVTEEEIDAWTKQFMTTGKNRFPRHPEPVTEELVHTIYHNSLKAYIVG